jgi:hypothetical protein
MIKPILCILATVLVFTQGCSSIFTSGPQFISVDSKPQEQSPKRRVVYNSESGRWSETIEYRRACERDTPAAYDDYLKRFGDGGRYASDVKNRLLATLSVVRIKEDWSTLTHPAVGYHVADELRNAGIKVLGAALWRPRSMSWEEWELVREKREKEMVELESTAYAATLLISGNTRGGTDMASEHSVIIKRGVTCKMVLSSPLGIELWTSTFSSSASTLGKTFAPAPPFSRPSGQTRTYYYYPSDLNAAYGDMVEQARAKVRPLIALMLSSRNTASEK